MSPAEEKEMAMKSWDGKTELILKNCPFCGYPPKIYHIGNDFGKKKALKIKCTNIHCRIERTDATLRSDFKRLEALALRAWNSRISHKEE